MFLDEMICICFNRFLLVMYRDTNDTIRVSFFHHTELKRYTIHQFPSFFRIVFPSTFFASRGYINMYPCVITKKKQTENRVEMIQKS